MFGSSQMKGANAYAKVGIETGVIAASPHKLIVMLFDGAIVSIGNAIQHLSANEIAAKGKSISKAISIIDNGLRASLDKKAGGDIAVSLDALYEYMSTRLILANLNNDENLLIEVQNLLKDLRSSWEAIAPDASSATEVPVINTDALAPRSNKFLEA
ncbi:flagellar export chaperone FliS [Undibacterium sp. Jales W-56]|uniref:flagellar export chaperone FliS n=1 Tax=Undibacterium sp. Jales W-56 TaxID=2897325 RepID=UPI0021CF75DF|nr:flagellar export chaperone FliS [Undibacterium sp. Jales W-56]MCU6435380.1 flagellar export chaperone FliS [Undibacterium sp. Jales W-56]